MPPSSTLGLANCPCLPSIASVEPGWKGDRRVLSAWAVAPLLLAQEPHGLLALGSTVLSRCRHGLKGHPPAFHGFSLHRNCHRNQLLRTRTSAHLHHQPHLRLWVLQTQKESFRPFQERPFLQGFWSPLGMADDIEGSQQIQAMSPEYPLSLRHCLCL